MFRPIALVGFVALLPTIVEAQGRAMRPAVSPPAAAAPRVARRGPQPVVTESMPVARIVVRTSAAPSRISPIARITRRPVGTPRIINADDIVFDSDFIAVPGLGFDIPHLAATRGPEAVGAGRRRHQFPFFFPFFNGGFFLPGSPVVVVEEASAPEAQQPEATEAEVPRTVRASPPAPSPAVEPPSTAPREADEFIFVRRDGTVFFAVAYAWENGVLRYITGEGLRRSVAKDALDLDRTQQFNEQRGFNFRAPA